MVKELAPLHAALRADMVAAVLAEEGQRLGRLQQPKPATTTMTVQSLRRGSSLGWSRTWQSYAPVLCSPMTSGAPIRQTSRRAACPGCSSNADSQTATALFGNIWYDAQVVVLVWTLCLPLPPMMGPSGSEQRGRSFEMRYSSG